MNSPSSPGVIFLWMAASTFGELISSSTVYTEKLTQEFFPLRAKRMPSTLLVRVFNAAAFPDDYGRFMTNLAFFLSFLEPN